VISRKYYIDKRCTKIAKKPNEKKRFSIIYQRTKVQKLGSVKNERVEKPN
jgi:hypothetical protein